MFTRLATFATLALPLLAAATPTTIGAGSSGGVIPGGGETTACCGSTESVSSHAPLFAPTAAVLSVRII